jgi:endonuclease/exonuclease/phosphatase family metal-dependent hydrolase
MRTGVLWLGLCWSLVVGCGERPLEPRDPTPGVPHYRFATYNIAHTMSGDYSTLRAVGKTDGDVIALQEINPAWRDLLSAHYAEAYPYMLFHALDGPKGLAFLSRFPLVDAGVLAAPNGWHPAWRVVVETPSGPIQLLNVHLRAMFDGSGNPVSSYLDTGDDHLLEIKLYLAQLEQLIPSVVVGDFNEGVGGRAITYLEGRGYRNALPLYRPGQPTWRAPSLANQAAMTIDHVLFDPAFEPLNAYVIAAGRSDHWPVVAHLELPGHAASQLVGDGRAEVIAPVVVEKALPAALPFGPEHQAVHEPYAGAHGDPEDRLEPPVAQPRRRVEPRLVEQSERDR